MTKLRKSAIGIVAVLSAGCFAAGTVAYAFGGNGGKKLNVPASDIRQLNGYVDNKTEQYFDSNVVYRLPETVSSEEEVSVIVSMSVDSVLDVYNSSHFRGTYQSFVTTEEARATSAKVERESDNLLKQIKAAGIKFKEGEKYSTLLSGFEIIVKASDFDRLNDMLEGDAQLIVGEEYNVEETQVVTNVVDVYETGIFDSSKIEYQGDGVVVAVLDTGCDYTHTAFSVDNFHPEYTHPDFELSKISEKVSKTAAAGYTAGLTGSDVYVSRKIPFAYDYADKDSDVAPINSSHGTHVAGIIAGQDDEITGVAPNAQLAIMKTFSDSYDTARTSWILSALEDCVTLGVDVINMSLGTSCGFSREIDDERKSVLYDKIKNTGISLVCAGNNDYNSTFGSEKNGNLPLTKHPDSGTVGAPSTYDAALSVASVDGVKTPYIKYEDDIIYFTEAMNSAAKKKSFVEDILKKADNVDSHDFQYVTIPGIGRSSDYLETGDYYHDKIVLVKRGTTMFEDKVRVALVEKGAAGIIIYNNVSGTISMSVGKDYGAVCSISQDEGEKLAEAGTGILHISREQVAGPFMSDFSSWGPTSDLKIKPEITAHGGEIYSAVPGQRYDRMSGTSMAAPNQAGATALIRQYVKFGTNADGSKIFGDLSATDVTVRVNQLMMSTADIVYNKNGLAYSVRKQGAGLMNLLSATTTASYVTTYEKGEDGALQPMEKPKLELGDDKSKSGVYEMTFDINNVSKNSVSYDIGSIVMTEGVSVTYTSHSDTTVTQDGYLFEDALFEITRVGDDGARNGSLVTVPAGGTAKVSVKITLTDSDKKYLDASFENGMYVEGFITLKAQSGTSVNLSVPLLAFYGDWTQAPIFDEEYYDTNKDELDKGLDEEDKLMADAFATRVIGGLYSDYISVMGSYYFSQDPRATQIAADKNKIAISNQEGENYSTINKLSYVYAGLLRNCREIDIVITEDATGRVIYTHEDYNQTKSYSSGSTIYASPIKFDDFSALEHNLKNNTKYTVTVSAYIDYGKKEEQKNKRSTFTFPLYVDFEAPVVTDVIYRTEYDRVTKETKLFADINIYDNHYAMGALIGQTTLADDPDYIFSLNSFGKYVTPVYSSFNSTSTISVELTDYVSQLKNSYGLRFDADGEPQVVGNTNSFIITCYDYAMNNATYEITLPDEIVSMYFEKNGEQVDEIKLSPNETLDLTTVVKVYPQESWMQTLDFSSDNDEVASVINQTVIAKQSGSAIITAIGHDADGNEVKSSVKITVLSPGDDGYVGGYTIPQVNKFALNSYRTNKAYYALATEDREIGLTDSVNYFDGNYTLSMYPSESVTIIPTLDSYFPERTTVVYSVGNSRVATVSEDGTIVAQAEGTTTVTASVRYNGNSTLYSERISITVKDPYTVNSIFLMSYKGLGGTVEIPKDRGITTIFAFAFSNYEYVDKDPEMGDIIDDEDPYFVKQWFIGDDTIEEIIIPDGVEEIQQYAFANLTALRKVVLPSTLKKIGLGAFYGCNKLKEINLENVQFINTNAFYGCALENIKLDSIVAIGSYSFSRNPLVSLTLPVTSQSLGEGAFADDIYLADIQFMAAKIKIAPYVFSGCVGLTRISINAAVISVGAFENCKNLERVTLGKDVAVIGEYAFAGTAVREFSISKDNAVFRTENNGVDIYQGDSLVLRAPMGNESNSIVIEATEIASGAFAGHIGLIKVSAPNATKIGAYAFANCENLTIVDMPNLKEIGDFAFFNTGLSATPDLSDIEVIGAYAFSQTEITSVEIPDGAMIGEGAFYWCTKLLEVTIGNNVTVGVGAFAGRVYDFTYETLDDDEVFDYFYKAYEYIIYDEKGEIRERTTFYRFDMAGASTSNLLKVEIGNNVKLESNAFAGNVKLNSLTLGDGAKIGEYAFFNANSLTEIDLSGALSIGDFAFSGAVTYDYYKVNDFSSKKGYVYVRAMNFFYEDDVMMASQYYNTYFAPLFAQADLSSATEVGIGAFAYNNKLTSVTLGNLDEIAPMAFAMTKVESLEIPASVTKVGEYAFFDTNITSVDLSNVTSIGDSAFGMNNLTYVKLKAGAVIGDSAFAYNFDLSEVVNLDKAVKIGSFAFMCSALKTLTLTDAEYIGDFAFGESSVTKVTLGEKLVELGENPFYGCAIETFGREADVQFNGETIGDTIQLTYDVSPTVKVINGVLYQTVKTGLELVSYPMGNTAESFAVEEKTVRISARAFQGSSIKNVTIASTVKSIGDKAFYGCSELSVVVFLSYYAPILEEEFDSTYGLSYQNLPIPGSYYGYEGLGITNYYMWTLGSPNNYYYGANFVDYIGHISDNIVIVKPANGQYYDTFIFSKYFKTVVKGSNAATADTISVIELINSIPANISLSDEDLIVSARAAYDNLTLEQQALVSNLSKLTNAEKMLAYLKKPGTTPPDTPPDTPDETPKSGNNVVSYIGYIIAGVAVLALIAYIVWTQLKARKSAAVTAEGGEDVGATQSDANENNGEGEDAVSDGTNNETKNENDTNE